MVDFDVAGGESGLVEEVAEEKTLHWEEAAESPWKAVGSDAYGYWA